MNDNGGTAGVKVFNAGMRGAQGHALAGRHARGVVLALAGHLQARRCRRAGRPHRLLPHARRTGRREAQRRRCRPQVEGRSLVPLLKNPERALARPHAVHPRRPLGAGAQAAAVQVSRLQRPQHAAGTWSASRKSGDKQWQLFDLKADPGEKTDVAAQHPEVVKELDAAYDQWWDSVQPQLVNENAVGPKVNPFKELYWKQFGGGPDAEILRQMDPSEAGKRGKNKSS